MNYIQFPLEIADKLKAITKQCMDYFDKDDYYTFFLPMPDDIVNEVNREFNKYDLPDVLNFLVIKRKNLLDFNTHIDSNLEGDVTYASLVIPVSGCENSAMYWASGEYETVLRELPGLKSTSKYIGINWKTTPTLSDKVEILDVPYLCRVDTPHSAYCNGSYRTILSLRFKGNPTFDEVVRKRFGHVTELV